MKTPSKVITLDCIGTCMSTPINKWESLMANTTKANGKVIRNLIKEHLPYLYESLALEFYNPYEYKCVKKDGLLVYVHSGIEYFLKYE